ncbi:MAG: AlpA family phage regulatory protein [Rubrivivax sp.]|nr:AlpA family phage regulatory protein [Rubrivivax sp.]
MTTVSTSTATTKPHSRPAVRSTPDRQSIRPKEAAHLLGIGLATLYRWQAERADMPRARKLGPRTTVYDRGELIAWRDGSPEAGQRA